MKILTALSLILLFALTASADCLEPTQEEIPRCRGTVMIRTPSESGAGLAIGYADDGVFVLTARHVVENAQRITVNFYDKKSVEFPARLEHQHPMKEVDLAVIKVFPAKNQRLPRELPTFRVREDVSWGEVVFIISNRDDLTWQMDRTSIRRHSNKDGDQRMFHYDSENLKLGSSGGPIFDKSGLLLGMVYEQPNGNDGEALKISQFWDLLNMRWGVVSLLTKGVEPFPAPVSPARLGLTNLPTIEVELTSILVFEDGGGGTAGWNYQVFLAEEEKLSKVKPQLKDAIPVPSGYTSPPYALTMLAKKREVPLSREDNLVLKVIATSPDAKRRVEGQAALDFSHSSDLRVGLTAPSNAPAAGRPNGSPQHDFHSGRTPTPAKGVFTFYFKLRKVKVSIVLDKNPIINAIGRRRGDLKDLIADGEKILEEADVRDLRNSFVEWRMDCGIVLDDLDNLTHTLKWRPRMLNSKGQLVKFREGFDEKVGASSEDISNLERNELVRRIRGAVRYINSVIDSLRDESLEPSPRPVKSYAP